MTEGLDPNDSRPPYRQIADYFREEIQAGRYAPGEKLPSVSELRDQYAVAINTVQAAMRILRDEGLVVSRQGKGVYVRTDIQVDDEDDAASSALVLQQLSTLSDCVERLADRVAHMEQLIDALQAQRSDEQHSH